MGLVPRIYYGGTPSVKVTLVELEIPALRPE